MSGEGEEAPNNLAARGDATSIVVAAAGRGRNLLPRGLSEVGLEWSGGTGPYRISLEGPAGRTLLAEPTEARAVLPLTSAVGDKFAITIEDSRSVSRRLRFAWRDGTPEAPAAVLAKDAEELLSKLILTKSFPAGIRRVREHRAAGHKTILITGAAGMIGRKLTERLAISRELNGQPVDRLTLIDVVAPQRLASFSDHEKTRAADLAEPGVAAKAVSERPDVIFHLAGVVSGEAELDFDKGYRVNLDGTRALLEAIRKTGDGYKPRLIFTSSMAVFGAPFHHSIGDDFHLTPLTSYGTQKAICEAMLADYTRRGFLEGVGIRLPSIVVRPGKPNKAASGFFSGIIREPLAGQDAQLPVAETVLHTHASPRAAVGFFLYATRPALTKRGPSGERLKVDQTMV